MKGGLEIPLHGSVDNLKNAVCKGDHLNNPKA